MNKIFFGILFAISSASYAQIPESWKLTEIKNTQQEPVGYIYHTESIGKDTSGKKYVTGLRFICSSKSSNNAILAVFWQGGIQDEIQSLEIKIDNKIIRSDQWNTEGPLLIKSFDSLQTLLKQMSAGKNLGFSWEANGLKYQTLFTLRGYDISKFKKICNL